jgi:uncharacterized protein YqhQ
MHQQPKSGTHHASPEPREVSVGGLVLTRLTESEPSMGSLAVACRHFNIRKHLKTKKTKNKTKLYYRAITAENLGPMF